MHNKRRKKEDKEERSHTEESVAKGKEVVASINSEDSEEEAEDEGEGGQLPEEERSWQEDNEKDSEGNSLHMNSSVEEGEEENDLCAVYSR